MPSFTNLEDLNKYLLKNSNAKLSNGKTIRQIMQEESRKLYKLIQKYIDAYYDSYSPEYYERTYRFKNSLRVEPVKQEGNIFSVRIYFDEQMATHDSLFSDKDAYIPLLYNDGWSWKDPTKAPYRFSHYEGFDFIGKAIEEYNNSNIYNFEIKVEKTYG